MPVKEEYSVVKQDIFSATAGDGRMWKARKLREILDGAHYGPFLVLTVLGMGSAGDWLNTY